MNHQSDQYYIKKVLEGDVNTFSFLVKRYQNFVYTITYRVVRNTEEAEEVAQDTFVKAFKSLASYKGDAKFSTWLYTIAYRKSLDAIKKRKRIPTFGIIEEISEGEIERVGDALKYLEKKEKQQKILEAIHKLPQEEAVLITLYYYDDKSVSEISEIVGLTTDNVKIKLSRSRKKLYSILKRYVSSEIN